MSRGGAEDAENCPRRTDRGAAANDFGVVDGEERCAHASISTWKDFAAPSCEMRFAAWNAALVVYTKVRGCGRREIVHHSRDAVLHQCSIEVQEKTNLQVHQAEIGQQLLRVDAIETLE